MCVVSPALPISGTRFVFGEPRNGVSPNPRSPRGLQVDEQVSSPNSGTQSPMEVNRGSKEPLQTQIKTNKVPCMITSSSVSCIDLGPSLRQETDTKRARTSVHYQCNLVHVPSHTSGPSVLCTASNNKAPSTTSNKRSRTDMPVAPPLKLRRSLRIDLDCLTAEVFALRRAGPLTRFVNTVTAKPWWLLTALLLCFRQHNRNKCRRKKAL